MTERIRVLVVDDSAFMRNALSREICSDPRFIVVGTACDGREGVEKALDLQPDVITLDVEMPVQGDSMPCNSSQRNPPRPLLWSVRQPRRVQKQRWKPCRSVRSTLFRRPDASRFSMRSLLRLRASGRALQGGTHPQVQQQAPAETIALPKSFVARAIVIGSSTGGPQALAELFTHLAHPLPVPVFIAQHMPRPFTAALARRLQVQSGHTVVEANDGDSIENGVVYIAPGGQQMRAGEGLLSVRQDAGASIYQPSVDVLTASVHDSYHGCVLGIMLTGLGRDGAREFKRLKTTGGWTIAQDALSCTVFGMPKALIDSGGACEVVPLKSIASRVSCIIGRA